MVKKGETINGEKTGQSYRGKTGKTCGKTGHYKKGQKLHMGI